MSIDFKAEWDERGPYAHCYLSSPTCRPRWITAGFTFGKAPGSNGMGRKVHAWRVWSPDMPRDGFALRLFHSFRRPCLTLLCHWRWQSEQVGK